MKLIMRDLQREREREKKEREKERERESLFETATEWLTVFWKQILQLFNRIFLTPRAEDSH